MPQVKKFHFKNSLYSGITGWLGIADIRHVKGSVWGHWFKHSLGQQWKKAVATGGFLMM